MTLTATLPQSPYQAAIVTLLKADATLTAMSCGSRIYDAVPDNTTLDFLAIGEWSVTSEDTLEDDNAGTGFDMSVTLHGYTDDEGGKAGYKKGQQFMGRVFTLLHNASLSATGFTTVLCQHENSIDMRDQDEAGRPKRHFISTYRIVAEAT